MLEQLNSKLLAPNFIVVSAPTLNYLSTITARPLLPFGTPAVLKG